MFQNKNKIDKELDLYRRELELGEREKILIAKEKYVQDIGELEHAYHSTKEERLKELEILSEEIKHRKEILVLQKSDNEINLQEQKKAFEMINEEKDKSIQRLEEEIKVLIGKLPEINLKDFNINVSK